VEGWGVLKGGRQASGTSAGGAQEGAAVKAAFASPNTCNSSETPCS
jgi:hypothetical protein